MVFLVACSLALQAATPAGWFLAGSRPASYEAGTDAQAASNGNASVYLKSKEPVSDGFGTLMQEFRADKYAGKRVRLSAFVKSEVVRDWAGLWRAGWHREGVRCLRDPARLAHERQTGWQSYAVVLDVPQDATGIFFGVLLAGSGTVWLNSVKFEIVGPEVPTTGRDTLEDEPKLDPSNRRSKQFYPCRDLRTDCPATAL